MCIRDSYWIARFWNRWGEWLAREPGRIHLVHYEDVRQAPRETLQAIAAHWSIELTETALDAAINGGTKEAMAQKIDPAAEPNVLQNRKEQLTDQFSGEAMALYRERIESLFDHSLGYDLLKVPGRAAV